MWICSSIPGPFGLSLAAQVAYDQVDHLVVGTPMGFWESHMPDGIYLRSECDWHLDPLDIHTIDAYLASQRLTRPMFCRSRFPL